MEAASEADAAIAGNMAIFSLWFSLSRGFEMVMGLFPMALLGISLNEFRANAPLVSRWSSAFSALGAILVIAAIVGASWLRIEAFGPFFAGGALPMFWLVWLGIRLSKSKLL